MFELVVIYCLLLVCVCFLVWACWVCDVYCWLLCYLFVVLV